MMRGVLSRARLVDHDRGIGTCSKGVRNVDASGTPSVRSRLREVAMNAGVFLGVDIGKHGHYALAVDATGKVIHQLAVANDEAALRQLVHWAKAHRASVVVDQPGGAAALLLRLCWQAAATCTGWPWRAPATSMLARARPIRR